MPATRLCDRVGISRTRRRSSRVRLGGDLRHEGICDERRTVGYDRARSNDSGGPRHPVSAAGARPRRRRRRRVRPRDHRRRHGFPDRGRRHGRRHRRAAVTGRASSSPRRTDRPATRCVPCQQFGLVRVAGDDPLVVDGSFGPITKDRVGFFQESWGLTQDGVAGRETWSFFSTFLPGPRPWPLREAAARRRRPTGACSPPSTCCGAHGATIVADGAFGPLSGEAARAFQQTLRATSTSAPPSASSTGRPLIGDGRGSATRRRRACRRRRCWPGDRGR